MNAVILHPNKLGGFGPPPPCMPPQATVESLSGFALFTPGELGYPRLSEHWCLSRDGDALCYALYRRHYSSAKNPRPKIRQFAAPGEALVLIGTDGLSLFVWTRQLYRADCQAGVNCAVFRNEGLVLSSTLIREAADLAWDKWPGERLFTFVDAGKSATSATPAGASYERAGCETGRARAACSRSQPRRLTQTRRSSARLKPGVSAPEAYYEVPYLRQANEVRRIGTR